MKDYVVYEKEKNKIIYEIIEEKNGKSVLRGVNYRKIIKVDSSEIGIADSDIIKNEEKTKNRYTEKMIRNSPKNKILGKVVHFDSDINYLNRCKELYRKMGVYCYPVVVKECHLVDNIKGQEFGFIPDVVVITGHDFYNGEDIKKLDSYTNSFYFAESIKEIKNKYPNAVIIAGACQSNYEALIANGANFASSPKRINVHVYDPAVIAIFVCVTSFRNIVNYSELEKYIDDLRGAFGGIETHGKMRMLY